MNPDWIEEKEECEDSCDLVITTNSYQPVLVCTVYCSSYDRTGDILSKLRKLFQDEGFSLGDTIK